MRGIIIGAGRGQRLMPITTDSPKCFAKVQDKRILEWIIQAFYSNGIREICFVGGYQIKKVQAEYPNLIFRHNKHWRINNILASLMCAQDLMDEPFICSYSDILFTPNVVRLLATATEEIVLALDLSWLERYRCRTDHPPSDAEKVSVSQGFVTRIHRALSPSETHGEFMGVAKFGDEGARLLKKSFARVASRHSQGLLHEIQSFRKAYLIELLQEMVKEGIPIGYRDTWGEYLEIDTQQDYDLARRQWKGGL